MFRLCLVIAILVILTLTLRSGCRGEARMFGPMRAYRQSRLMQPMVQPMATGSGGLIYIGDKKKKGDIIIIGPGGQPGPGVPIGPDLDYNYNYDYDDYGGVTLFKRPLMGGLLNRPLNRPSLLRRPLFG